MKKNKMFWSMMGLSTTLHGLVIIGVDRNGFSTPSPVLEDQFVSTVKIIRVGTRPQKNDPVKPQEKKIVEKAIEPHPEILPVQEITSSEEIWEDNATQEGDNKDEQVDNEIQGDKEDVSGDGTITDHEYEALLAYIKDFINKNLVYPPMARRRNIEGIVGVSFEIDINRSVSSITVNHSSGSSILDNAAVSLMKKIHLLENMTIKRKLALTVNIDYELRNCQTIR